MFDELLWIKNLRWYFCSSVRALCRGVWLFVKDPIKVSKFGSCFGFLFFLKIYEKSKQSLEKKVCNELFGIKSIVRLSEHSVVGYDCLVKEKVSQVGSEHGTWQTLLVANDQWYSFLGPKMIAQNKPLIWGSKKKWRIT